MGISLTCDMKIVLTQNPAFYLGLLMRNCLSSFL